MKVFFRPGVSKPWVAAQYRPRQRLCWPPLLQCRGPSTLCASRLRAMAANAYPRHCHYIRERSHAFQSLSLFSKEKMMQTHSFWLWQRKVKLLSVNVLCICCQPVVFPCPLTLFPVKIKTLDPPSWFLPMWLCTTGLAEIVPLWGEFQTFLCTTERRATGNMFSETSRGPLEIR